MATTDARPAVEDAPDVPVCAGAGLDPGPADESDGELLARLGTDARAWASQFVHQFAGETVTADNTPGGCKLDTGLLVGWFAGAIEAGRSAGALTGPFPHVGLAAAGLPVGEVPVPLYAHLDGRDPVHIGQLVIAMNAVAGGDPFRIEISPDVVDRSQWVERADYDGACKTIAEMHEAATGRRGEAPARGVVQDVADVRARMLAAEEALSNALRRPATSK